VPRGCSRATGTNLAAGGTRDREVDGAKGFSGLGVQRFEFVISGTGT